MDFLALTIFDYVALSIVAISVIFAIVRGFVNSFLSLNWLGSFFLPYITYYFPMYNLLLRAKLKTV